MKVVAKPKLNSRWISRNGQHKGMEVIVSKVSDTTVVIMPLNGHRRSVVKGPLTWRLPLDAFYRRYVQV